MKRFLKGGIIASLALILTNNPIHAQCYTGVSLDGVDDYLYTPFADYNFNNFTFEMLINSQDFNPNEHYISLFQNAYIVLGGWDPGGVFNTWADGLNPIEISTTSANTPATGTWHHVAFVYDGNNQMIYIDGILITSVGTNGAVNLSTGFNLGLVIGARHDQIQQHSHTSFEDVRIWTVARSQMEISANMNANLQGNEPGLVAYYRFEDGQGSSTVADLSGNGNTLTMYNMDPLTDWIEGSNGIVYYTDVQTSCVPLTWIDGNTYGSDTVGVTYLYPGGSVSGCDSIVTLDLTILEPTFSSESVTECDSYTWNTNGQTYTQSGQYTEVFTNQVGCDSTVTLNLTINSSSSSTQTDTGLDSYTWSVNNQTYTESGIYTAVIPNESGCDSTITLDLTLQFTGLDENESSYVAVYPNPTYNSFTLSTKDMIHMNYTLVDIQGKVVLTGKIESIEQTVDISKLSNGPYNLVFEDENISPISIIKN